MVLALTHEAKSTDLKTLVVDIEKRKNKNVLKKKKPIEIYRFYWLILTEDLQKQKQKPIEIYRF